MKSWRTRALMVFFDGQILVTHSHLSEWTICRTQTTVDFFSLLADQKLAEIFSKTSYFLIFLSKSVTFTHTSFCTERPLTTGFCVVDDFFFAHVTSRPSRAPQERECAPHETPNHRGRENSATWILTPWCARARPNSKPHHGDTKTKMARIVGCNWNTFTKRFA